MLENSRKRARKSKLEVREGVELEEATVLYMEASDIKIKEEPLIDVGPTTVLIKNTHIQDPLNDVATPVTDHRPMMEFSVKIEVEECDETGSKEIPDDNNEAKTNENIPEDNDTKTVIGATTSLKQVKPINFTVTSGNIEAEKSNKKEFKEYVTNRPMMLKIVERILRLNQVPDTFLAIGVRNYAGQMLHETVRDARDTVLYNALEDWQKWHQEHSAVRDAPLIYKCYICGCSWWYFHEFRQHIDHHTKLKYFEVSLEPNTDECSLICYQLGVIYKDVVLPKSCCDRCGKTVKSHAFVNNDPYKCIGCKTTFSTCTQLKLHENQCPQYRKLFFIDETNEHKCTICLFECNHESKLYDHMIRKHLVRSDMVTTWDVKKCNICSGSYILMALHICLKKTNNYGCNYCGKSFQKKIYKEIHMATNGKPTQCRICNKQLMTTCMEFSHMLQHTDRYALMYKCIQCIDGRYYPDEFSITHHTKAVHDRPFEKKFKYLEMVILPKQCLEKTSTPPQVGKTDKPKPAQKDDVSTSKIFVPSSKYRTTLKQQMPVDVVVKQEPMSNDLDIDTLCVSDLSSIKMEVVDESKPHIQISDITSLQDFIKFKTEPVEEVDAEDLIIIEDKAETIEVCTSDDDSENDFRMEPAGVNKKKLKRVTCICGYVDIPSRIKAHKLRCVATLAKLADEKQAKALGKRVSNESEDEEKHNSDEDWGQGMPLDKKSKNGLRYTCHCKRVFVGTLTAFRRHKKACTVVAKLKKDIKPTIFTCTKCNSDFNSMLKYCKHLNRTHYFQKFMCPQCMYTCDNLIKLTSHVTSHVNRNYSKIRVISSEEDWSKGSKCKLCKRPIEKKDFFKHWEAHLKLDPGDARVEQDSDSAEEGLVIDGPASPPAYREGRSLYSAETMQRALAWLQSSTGVGGVDEKTCVFCARRFSRRNDSKRHVIEHLLQDAYAQRSRLQALRCQLCAADFGKDDRFKHHMREHAGLPVYQCNLCGKSFSDSSNFCKHRKVHGLSLMRCHVCEKKFHNPSHLERHLEMHERTKPIICDTCGKVSYTQSAHKKHVRCAHERHRTRVLCPVCKAGFTRLKDKWDHMWQAHKERKFKADCPMCSQAFRRFADVKTHVKQMHRMNVRLNADQRMTVYA